VISTFVGVLWRNQLVSIMVTLFLWFGSWGLYRIYFSTGWRELLPSWAYSTIGGLHLVSPRVSEVGNAARRIMYDGIGLSPESMQLTSIHPTSSLLEISLATIGFIAVVHALSCWIFVRRDH
jgi:ABC-type transport system involved in multi-copper enzyme maturation permease subunit